MKHYINGLVCVIIACVGLQFTQAYAQEDQTILAADFKPLKIFMANEDETLIAGYTGTPMKRVPTIMQLTHDGETYSFQEALVNNVYFDAAYLSPNQWIALRYDNEPSREVVAVVIKQGEVSQVINGLGQANRIFIVSDGYVFHTTPSTGNGTIEKRDVEGRMLWQQELPRMTMVNALIEENQAIYLIGSYQAYQEDYSIGTILKLDDKGNLLWRYDSEEKSEYLQGFLLSDLDAIVVTGNAYPSFQQGIVCTPSITKIQEGELVWYDVHNTSKQENPTDCEFLSATQMGTHFLIASQQMNASGSILLQQYDENGKCIESREQSIQPIHLATNTYFRSQHGTTVLSVHGYDANDFHVSVLIQIK